MKNASKKTNRTERPKYAELFFGIILSITSALGLLPPVYADQDAQAQFKVVEELTPAEKKKMIQDLIEEGDRYSSNKDYNHAASVYESVFLLEPEHVEASERIDRLKKLMLKEGKVETQAIGSMYETEIEARAHFYLARARQLLEEGKKSQARLELEKLLLLDPFHGEGKKLYEELNADSAKEPS